MFGIVALVAAGCLPLHSNGDCNSLNLNTAPLTAAPAAERHSHAAWQGQSDRRLPSLDPLFHRRYLSTATDPGRRLPLSDPGCRRRSLEAVAACRLPVIQGPLQGRTAEPGEVTVH